MPVGGFFELETGDRWTAIECSDFNLFGRYLTEGEAAIVPVLEERAELGFNLLRVWLAYDGNAQFTAEIGRLVPAEHPEMYAALPAFLARCADFGLYVELTAFTAGPIPGHWDAIGAALGGVTNVLVELCNENNAHAECLDTSQYHPIPGIVCSRGSNGSQSPPERDPYQPPLSAGASGWWDYETFHTNDAYEWQRKVGHNAMEFSQGTEHLAASHVPVLSNENTRPDHDGNEIHFYDAAAAAALLCAGSCFHSQSGKRSSLFDARDRAFAEAWAQGALSINLAYQPGAYRHPIELEGPDDLRVYQRVLGDGSAETAVVRK